MVRQTGLPEHAIAKQFYEMAPKKTRAACDRPYNGASRCYACLCNADCCNSCCFVAFDLVALAKHENTPRSGYQRWKLLPRPSFTTEMPVPLKTAHQSSELVSLHVFSAIGFSPYGRVVGRT